LILVLIPSLVALMVFIRRQYDKEDRELVVRDDAVFEGPRRRQRVVVPVPGLTRVVVQAVNFARTISKDVRAVFFTDDVEEGERLRVVWERQLPGVPLTVVETPYRQLVNPFLTYLDVMEPDPDAITVVVVPEFVARHWWERYLHNAASTRLRHALVGRPDTVVASLPYRREH
jgi:hypothetical protein